jgi:hypothetical protein
MNTRPTPETDALRDLYENHEHRANVGDIWDLCESLERELNEARDQRDKLAEALRDMLSGWEYIRLQHGYLHGVGWDRVQTKAEHALQSLTPKKV